MEDFVVNARNLSVGAGRNKHLLKEAEIYFQSARRNRSTETFAICIQVLLTSGREGSSSVKAPENIVAAQTLCWICKHNQLSEEQFSSLVAALRWQVGVGTNHPVTVQLTAAISAAIVIAHVPSENWLGNSLQLMLEVLHSNSDAQQRWVYCVVSIVGCVPEVAASKDVICTINDQKCAQWTNNLSLSALAQQIVKGVCIHQSVLHQSAVVDQMLNMALSSTSVGDSELLAACLRCCVFWVEFAASALQSLPGDCESAEVLQVLELQCTSAVRSLALWTSSTVLTAATDLLLHSSGNHSNAVEACVELLVALCTALSSDTEAQASAVCKGGGSKLQQQASSSSAPNSGRKKTAKASIRSNSGSSQQAALVALSGSIRGELRCMKHNLTQQLLPVLAASLATQAQSLQALHSALATQKQHQHQQQQQQVQEGGWLCDVEGALNTCLTVFRGNCECISALLNPPFSEILAGNHSDLSTLTPLAQLWVQYLTSFSESVRSHTDAFSEMSKLDTLADVWEEIDPLRQLLTMLLPVATALAEHLPVSPSAAPQDSSSSVSCGEVDSLRAQLTALVHGLVEGAVVAAVTAAAYPEPPVVNLRSTSADWGSAAAVSLFTPKQSLQEQENLEDYRYFDLIASTYTSYKLTHQVFFQKLCARLVTVTGGGDA